MKRLADCSWIPFSDAELANAILNNALHSCLALPKVSIISAWQICFFVCLFFNIGMACFICTDISVTTYRETTDPTRQLVCRKQRVPKKTEQVRVWGALKLECSQLCYLWSYWRLFLLSWSGHQERSQGCILLDDISSQVADLYKPFVSSTL